MNVTLTQTIPQNVDVQTSGFQLAAALTVPLQSVTEVTMICVPGPPGPPGNNGVLITVSDTEPVSPSLNDLWVDTN